MDMHDLVQLVLVLSRRNISLHAPAHPLDDLTHSEASF
jgi:hypothetical protein